MLTTLQGARFFADPRLYSNAPGDAYISAVRVRVAGIGRADEESRRRLEGVALAIHQRTGLRVDVVKGASARDVRVALPAGRFGRPALEVRERWSVKGVALRFGTAISAQNVALLVIALATAGLLMGQTAYVSVRRRRGEFAALRAMGWRRRDLAGLVAREQALVGLLAGMAATGLGLAILARGDRALAPAALPAALALAVLPGLLAAAQAGRGTVTARFGHQPQPRLSRPPRSAAGVGVRGLARAWRGDAVVAVVAVAVGAASVGAVVLVAAGFDGRLDTTVLGRHLDARAGAAQIAAAVLTALLAAGVGAQVLLLSYLERRAELGCLRALGWPRRALGALVAGQGLVLSLAGATLAVATVAAAGAATGAGAGAILVAAAAALAVTTVIGLSMISVLLVLLRGPVVDTLRGD